MADETVVTQERLEQYFSITKEALAVAKDAPVLDDRAGDVLDMAERYVRDAEHFSENGNRVLAFAALNYAHGWLDCGAANDFFDVSDDRLFTVDPEN